MRSTKGTNRWWAPASASLLLAALALGCGTGRGASASDGGSLPDGGGALTIDTDALPGAIAGQHYSASLKASGGTGSRLWSLPGALPGPLAWMTLDAAGTLTGTPSAVTEGNVTFSVEVTDATASVRKSLSLGVTCHEGDAIACGLGVGQMCVAGTRRCTGGKVTDCAATGDAGTEDFSICGAGCQACDSVTANLCTDGRCACGAKVGGCQGAASTCCAGASAADAGCFDTQTDVHHCGQCGQDCIAEAAPSKHLAPQCLQALCDFSQCEPHHSTCGGPVGLNTGCPIDLDADPQHCGDCSIACSANHNTPTCSSGTCIKNCASGWDHCSGNVQLTGCETNTAADVSHCGNCTNSCPAAPANGFATCESSTCTFECNAGFQKCGGACVPLDDNNHCGSCSKVCNPDLQQCVSGACCPVCDSGLCCGGSCVFNPTSGTTHCVK